MFNEGVNVLPYFSGDSPNGKWNGTSHQSTSTLYRNETSVEYNQRVAAKLKNASGFKRGTPSAIVAAAQQSLTGNKTVILRERDPGAAAVNGGAYGLTVLTYVSETQDEAKVLADLMSQKPAGIVLNYQTITGSNYLLIRTTYTNYSTLRSAFATYNGLRNNVPGT